LRLWRSKRKPHGRQLRKRCRKKSWVVREMNLLLLNIIILIYLLATLYLGYRGWKSTKDSEGYLVAGRKTHPYIMAMSYGATFISTSAIVGFGGTAGLFGMGLLWLTFLNIFVGIFLAFIVYGNEPERWDTT